eukprot:CAMPEP_0172529854 /NCGR_PEP_ID=MMETSP1067-20121228/3809_1 /TAXON_ID=265564 ORGANISM="Thalassiosira punctigera, Strain Tpunct2005C2" /NCGR_SAMPLE_ID=MMETSP1067 /ASSEMBLY_ACC=CAM_ASM_000444 /LENGTH=337 /DNA_ID=CAMNT_0013313977 /DNA_START=29 /DNA_END=1042 /DNA_ORIENTATION=+
MKRSAVLLALAASSASAVELSSANWDDATSGKAVLLKFFAPWCHHCQEMKPDWDRLERTYSGNAGLLVAEVDCTGHGFSLCTEYEVRSYPAIKYGDPTDLRHYAGKRDFDSLKKFADENVVPACGVFSILACDDEERAVIEAYLQKSTHQLKQEVKMMEFQKRRVDEAVEEMWKAGREKAVEFELMKQVLASRAAKPEEGGGDGRGRGAAPPGRTRPAPREGRASGGGGGDDFESSREFEEARRRFMSRQRRTEEEDRYDIGEEERAPMRNHRGETMDEYLSRPGASSFPPRNRDGRDRRMYGEARGDGRDRRMYGEARGRKSQADEFWDKYGDLYD